jgi:DNA-binding NarL/FixJ family response regulator
MSISVILADDHPIVRQGLRQFLESEADLSVVSEAADGPETIRAVEQLKPDVLVLDLVMPGLAGLDVIPAVRHRSPQTRVVVFSMCESAEFVLRAMRAGATGYVLKGGDPRNVLEGIRKAARGEPYLGPPLAGRGLEAAGDAAADPHELLTPREREVLQLSAEGHTTGLIASQLSISPRTVEAHRANLMRKLSLKSQTELIRYALRRGLIALDN